VSEIASHDVNNERQVQSLPSFTSVVTVLHGGMEPPASEANLLLPIAYWSAPALKVQGWKPCYRYTATDLAWEGNETRDKQRSRDVSKSHSAAEKLLEPPEAIPKIRMHDKTGNDADAFSWHAALLEALLSPSSPFTPHSPTTFQGPPDPRYLSRRSANRILILSHILPATSNPEGIMLTRSPPTSQPQLRIGFVALLFQGLSEGLCTR